MNTQPQNTSKHRPSSHASRGFSIIEVMVGLTVSLILGAGLIQIFIGNKQSHDLIQASAWAQENGRHALRMMRQQARLAGLRTAPEELPIDRFFGSTLALWGSTGVTLQSLGKTDAGDVLNERNVQVAVGTNLNRALTVKSDTDVLVVRYQGAQDGTTRDCLSNNVAADIYATDSFYIGVNDITADDSRGVARFSLYCVSDRIANDGITGQPFNTAPQILADGLVDLEISYGEDGNGDSRANRYLTDTAAGIDFSRIVSIKLILTAQGGRPVDLSNELATNTEQLAVEGEVRREFYAMVSLRNLAP